MGHGLGLLAPDEAASLAGQGVRPPEGFVTLSELVSRVVTLEDGRAVGVLAFPPLPPGQAAPSAGMAAAIADQAAALRTRTGLVVGVSAWGYPAELDYLSNHQPVVDVLLGSGMGPGTFQSVADGRLLWLRPYGKGRTVHTLTLRRWPARSGDRPWDQAAFRHENEGLDDTRPSDPAVFERLEALGR